MSEIANPVQDTYWIITDGSKYAAGLTGVGQTTTVGNGWSIWWSGTDKAQYDSKCAEVGVEPVSPMPLPD